MCRVPPAFDGRRRRHPPASDPLARCTNFERTGGVNPRSVSLISAPWSRRPASQLAAACRQNDEAMTSKVLGLPPACPKFVHRREVPCPAGHDVGAVVYVYARTTLLHPTLFRGWQDLLSCAPIGRGGKCASTPICMRFVERCRVRGKGWVIGRCPPLVFSARLGSVSTTKTIKNS